MVRHGGERRSAASRSSRATSSRSTGGFGGGFVVARAATGVVVWRFDTQAAAVAPLIEAGGHLIGGDMNGHLYAFRPHR